MKDEMPKFRVRRAGANVPSKPDNAPLEPPLNLRGEPTGRVQFDERGNAVWDWAAREGRPDQGGLAKSLKVLDNPTLSLADDAPTPSDVVKPNPLGVVKGYNPYDSGKLDRKRKGGEAKKDLRKLSEWIKLRKQAEGNDPHEE
jgi:hypothetical protein